MTVLRWFELFFGYVHDEHLNLLASGFSPYHELSTRLALVALISGSTFIIRIQIFIHLDSFVK